MFDVFLFVKEKILSTIIRELNNGPNWALWVQKAGREVLELPYVVMTQILFQFSQRPLKREWQLCPTGARLAPSFISPDLIFQGAKS